MSILFFIAGFIVLSYVFLMVVGVSIGLGSCAVSAARAVRKWQRRRIAAPNAPRRLAAPAAHPAAEPAVAIAVAPAAA